MTPVSLPHISRPNVEICSVEIVIQYEMTAIISLSTCLLAVIAVSNSATVVSKDDQQRMRETAEKIIAGCKEKVGATDADMQAVRTKKMPTSETGMCLVECIFDNTHIMKDGQLNKEGTMQAMGSVFQGDKTKLKKLNDLIDVCTKEIGTEIKDRCKVAGKIVECGTKHGGEFDVKIAAA